MDVYRTKRPSEAKGFALDWQELEPSEVLTEDLGWLIVPQELDAQALTLASSALEAARSVAVLAGGRAGHLYHVSQRVRTNLGRVLSRALLLRVVEG
jgi:hypothetical protein